MVQIKTDILIVIFLISNFCLAQLSDLAKVDFTYLPRGHSSVGYSRLRGLFNYPFKTKKKGSFFLIGLDYSKIELSFDDHIDDFDIGALDNFQLLDLNIGYTFKMNDRWRFGARFTPGFSSNLVNDLSLEDIIFSGDIVFIHDKKEDQNVKKPYRLVLGISYSQNRGIPFPIPFISYYRKFHPNWSYKLGIPKFNLQYHLSQKARFKIIAELDGFTSNIQEKLAVNNGQLAERANMSIVVVGLRYEYKFTKHTELYFNLSRTVSSKADLKDNRNKTVISINRDNIFYLRTGFRFKI